MAKEKEPAVVLDDVAINSDNTERVPVGSTKEIESNRVMKISEEREELINCLRNEKITVRFIARAKGGITNPEHIFYGGMANGSKMSFTVPLLRSGGYVDILTKEEKKFLEWKMGLEPNALSVHNRTNNFWDDSNELGIGRVILIKGDNPFDLSKPIDYIKYKILLANKEQIAPSMSALQDKPKATYRFVIISEADTAKAANVKVGLKQQAYMEFGKLSEDKDKLRIIIETIDGRPTAANSKLDYLQGKVGELIESNTRMFLNVVKDPLLDNKILIKKAIEAGIIANRGNYLYMRDGNTPLCDNGQEPTLNIAAKYLSLAKHQELLFSIQAKLKATE